MMQELRVLVSTLGTGWSIETRMNAEGETIREAGKEGEREDHRAGKRGSREKSKGRFSGNE